MTTIKPSGPHARAVFATGGGGTVFEIDVATWLAGSMAAGRISPLGGRPVALQFQTTQPGFDDIRVEMADTGGPTVYDVQVRHRQQLTGTNEKFQALVEGGCSTIAADPEAFAGRKRRLVLVVGPGSPAHTHLSDLCRLAESTPSADPAETVSSARATIQSRWQHLCDAAPNRRETELWTFAANLNVIAVDLSSRSAPPVTAVLNEVASLWQPSSPLNASNAMDAVFRLMARLIPTGGSVDEQDLRTALPSLPPADAEPSRRTRLHRVAAASSARIAGSLRALGIQDADLLEALVGHCLGDTRPIPDVGIWLVEGDMGVGKTAVLERDLHLAVQAALDDPNAPVPVHIRATETRGGPLRELVLNRALEVGDPYRTGIWLVLDGLDEAGLSPSDVATDLVSLRGELPPSTLLAGTRPGNVAAGLEVHRVRPLDDEAATALLNVLGVTRMARHASETLATTLQLPLFAILYAVHRSEGEVTSPAELVERMARSGISDLERRAPDAIVPLTRLARSVLDASGAPVPIGDLQLTPAEAAAFGRSRLVDTEAGCVSFQVAALTEWFGGAALRGDRSLLTAVAADPRRSHSWRYAVASMVAQLADSDAYATMEVLVGANPALARWAVHRATSTVWGAPPVPPPQAAAAAAVNRAFGAWHEQLSPAASAWRPGPQQPPVIGVSRDDNGISLAVAACSELEIRRADASILFPSAAADEYLPRVEAATWIPFRFGRIGSGSAWVWDLTSKIFVDHLMRMVTSGDIAASATALFPETLWRYAAATQPGPPKRRVAVDDVEAEIARVRAQLPEADSIIVAGYARSDWNVDTAERLVAHCRRKAITVIERPWAPPVWDRTDPASLDAESLTNVLAATSDGGLAAYEQIATASLPRLAPHLSLAAILPARVRGWVAVVESPWQSGVFDLDYVWTVEPAASPSETSTWELVEAVPDIFDLYRSEEGRTRIEALRPGAPPSVYSVTNHGDGPWETTAPTTAFALEHLAEDLKRYSWWENTLPREPPFVEPVFPPAD